MGSHGREALLWKIYLEQQKDRARAHCSQARPLPCLGLLPPPWPESVFQNITVRRIRSQAYPPRVGAGFESGPYPFQIQPFVGFSSRFPSYCCGHLVTSCYRIPFICMGGETVEAQESAKNLGQVDPYSQLQKNPSYPRARDPPGQYGG